MRQSLFVSRNSSTTKVKPQTTKSKKRRTKLAGHSRVCKVRYAFPLDSPACCPAYHMDALFVASLRLLLVFARCAVLFCCTYSLLPFMRGCWLLFSSAGCQFLASLPNFDAKKSQKNIKYILLISCKLVIKGLYLYIINSQSNNYIMKVSKITTVEFYREEIQVTVHAKYYPPCKGSRDSYGCPLEPDEPAEIEILSVIADYPFEDPDGGICGTIDIATDLSEIQMLELEQELMEVAREEIAEANHLYAEHLEESRLSYYEYIHSLPKN